MPIPNDLAHLVFEHPALLDLKQRTELISYAETVGFDSATITTEEGTAVDADVRNNDRVFYDSPLLADRLWAIVQTHFCEPFKDGVAVGLNERFRIYRYAPGQFFDWHQDGSFRQSTGLESRFTMMVYLNDDFEGGGTSFADVFSPHVFQDFTVTPKAGAALFFHHPLSHRGNVVVQGRKYVLRTDVMFKVPVC